MDMADTERIRNVERRGEEVKGADVPGHIEAGEDAASKQHAILERFDEQEPAAQGGGAPTDGATRSEQAGPKRGHAPPALRVKVVASSQVQPRGPGEPGTTKCAEAGGD